MGKEDYLYFTVFIKASPVLQSWRSSLVQWRDCEKNDIQISFHSSSNALFSLMDSETNPAYLTGYLKCLNKVKNEMASI